MKRFNKCKIVRPLLISNIIFFILVFANYCYAGTAANRGHTEQNAAGGIGLFNSIESIRELNVPLPNANTNYYYNNESIDIQSLKQPIVTINKIVAYVNKG
ncbi:MAG: hypothetical protein RL017_37, partial [Pseudomonadota bacterium]